MKNLITIFCVILTIIGFFAFGYLVSHFIIIPITMCMLLAIYAIYLILKCIYLIIKYILWEN